MGRFAVKVSMVPGGFLPLISVNGGVSYTRLRTVMPSPEDAEKCGVETLSDTIATRYAFKLMILVMTLGIIALLILILATRVVTGEAMAATHVVGFVLAAFMAQAHFVLTQFWKRQAEVSSQTVVISKFRRP